MISARHALLNPSSISMERDDRTPLDVLQRMLRYSKDPAEKESLRMEFIGMLTDSDPKLRSAALFVFCNPSVEDDGQLVRCYHQHLDLYTDVFEHWGRTGSGDLRSRLVSAIGMRAADQSGGIEVLRAEAFRPRFPPAAALMMVDAEWALENLAGILERTPSAVRTILYWAAIQRRDVEPILDVAMSRVDPLLLLRSLAGSKASTPTLEARIAEPIVQQILAVESNIAQVELWDEADAGWLGVLIGGHELRVLRFVDDVLGIVGRADLCAGCKGADCTVCHSSGGVGWSGDPPAQRRRRVLTRSIGSSDG